MIGVFTADVAAGGEGIHSVDADPVQLGRVLPHARALFALAEGLPPGARVGVDVEHAGRAVNADGLARKFLCERERAALAPLDADARRGRFLRLWTCKEAMSKATGDALSAQGKLEVKTYLAADGVTKISRSIVADSVLALRKERKAKAPPPGSKAADAIVKQSIEGSTDKPAFYDEEIPF